jgi:putative FmdB family regulatory protein
MPTYEYKCTRCGEITSEFKPMSAPRRRRCPICRCKVDLLITGGLGIVFKGEGFYVNDSRAAARSSARPGVSKPGGDRPGGDGPSDSKPGGSEADTRPKPDGAGEKPVAASDKAVQNSKSTDKARD